MTTRQWPATKIGTAWLTYDPEDGWSEHDNPADAEREFGAIVDHLCDEASDGWHEYADTAAWGIWIPIERLRLVATAWPDDDTEDGERCRGAGWGAFLSGRVEPVPSDDHAIGFCTQRRAAAFAEFRLEIERLTADRDTARAEADALRAEVARLQSNPLATLLHRIPATEAPFVLTYHPDADPMRDGSGWLCEVDDWSTHAGPLDTVIAAACDRLGVGHG